MDIVERLRDAVNRHYGKDPCGMMAEAADEIELLRGQLNLHHDLARANEKIERLRKTLRELLYVYDNQTPFVGEIFLDRFKKAWENARAALKEGK